MSKFMANSSLKPRGKRPYKGSSQFRKKMKVKGRASRIPLKVQGLSRQVKELKRLAEADTGTHVQRIRICNRIAGGNNTQNHASQLGSDISTIESVLAELRYYNPSAPSSLVQASGVTGSYQKEFYFTKVYTKITVRNNYIVPCQVRVYGCRPRKDTSISPDSAFTSGLVDVGGISASDTLTYLTDSIQFTDMWRIDCSKIVTLDPGRQITLTMKAKPFMYDPATVDLHGLSYQDEFQSMVWQIHCMGCLSHDSGVSTEQGLGYSGVDYMAETTFEVKYNAGSNIKYVVLQDNADSFTNGAVLTNKPVADNQAYSMG